MLRDVRSRAGGDDQRKVEFKISRAKTLSTRLGWRIQPLQRGTPDQVTKPRSNVVLPVL